MDFSQFSVLLTQTGTEGKYVIEAGGTAANQTAAATTEASAAQAPSTDAAAPPTAGVGSMVPMLLIYVVVIGGFMYFMNRKQKKEQKQRVERQNSLKIGDNVCTSTGFYGKIVDVEEQVFIVEFGTNKGVRIPVRKADVYPAKGLDETESTPSNS